MKGVITVACGLAIAVNAQFNVEIDNGLRVGILGSQIANIGGNNKGQQFKTGSWPVDALGLISTPEGPVHQPPKQMAATRRAQKKTRNKPTQGMMGNSKRRAEQKVQHKEPTVALNENQSKTSQEKKQAKVPKHHNDLIINQFPKAERNYQHVQKKEQEIQAKQEQIVEKQNEKQEMELLIEKQDERLAKFIKLMPESQKQHLRAIATDKTQS